MWGIAGYTANKRNVDAKARKGKAGASLPRFNGEKSKRVALEQEANKQFTKHKGRYEHA